MLWVYSDDSEQKGDGVICVAGYIWDKQGADAFMDRWTLALDEMNIREHGFHMTAFESRKGPFRDWTNTQRIERLQRLHEITNCTMLGGVWIR